MENSKLSIFGSKPPDKTDMLFRSDEDWGTNAYLGYRKNDYVYSNGFRRGAELLAEHVCDNRRELDFLIYPIVYLYRHHIELMLKRIIESAFYLLDRALTEDKLKKRLGHHGLLKLWQTARPLLNQVCDRAGNSSFPELDLEGIDSYIGQIHSHDPDGQRFRYATIKSKGASEKGIMQSLSPNLTLINVRIFADTINKLVLYLEGIDDWFLDLRDKQNADR